MERSGLGGLLAVVGAALALSGSVLAGYAHLLSSPRVFEASGAEIGRIHAVRDVVTAELATSVSRALPSGSIEPAVAVTVAERMIRNPDLVEDLTRALTRAQPAWLEGDPLVIELEASVLAPVAIASLRDVDLAAARMLGETATFAAGPIEVPLAVSGPALRAMQAVGLVVLISGLLAVAGGVVLQRRSAELLGRVGAMLVVCSILLGFAAASAPLTVPYRLDPLASIAWVALGAHLAPALSIAASLLLSGLMLRGVARRLAEPASGRRAGRRRMRRAATAGSDPGTRPAREEALDVFFDPAGPQPRRELRAAGSSELQELRTYLRR